MSNHTFQSPVYGLACDRDGCDVTFKPQSKFAQCGESGWAARSDAKAAGWQVRPPRGRGSRSEPDLCPAHSELEASDD
jgi:hypothetical protein